MVGEARGKRMMAIFMCRVYLVFIPHAHPNVLLNTAVLEPPKESCNSVHYL